MTFVKIEWEEKTNRIHVLMSEDTVNLMGTFHPKEAVEFFNGVKSGLESIGKKQEATVKASTVCGDFTWTISKKILTELKAALALEIDIANGKTKRPIKELFDIKKHLAAMIVKPDKL